MVGKLKDGVYHFQHSEHRCNNQSSHSCQQPPTSLTSSSSPFHSSNNNSLLFLSCNKEDRIACTSMNNSVANIDINVWHCRLGYIPISKLSLLHKFVHAITFNEHLHCAICPMAKQYRLPFPNSERKTSKTFELIHYDIWGPYSIPALDGSKYFLTIVDD